MRNKPDPYHPFFDRFTFLIESAKIHNKKSVRDISQETAILRSALYNYLERVSMPSVTTLEILADYFGVTTDYLLGREEQ